MYQNPLSKNYSWGCKNGSAGKNISCSPKELDFDSQPPHQVAPSHLRHQLLGNQYLYSDMHRDTHKHMRRSVVEASQAMPRGEQRSRAKVAQEAHLRGAECSVPVVQSSKHYESWLEAIINVQIDVEAKPQPGDAFTLTVSRSAVHLSPFLKSSNKERGETGRES